MRRSMTPLQWWRRQFWRAVRHRDRANNLNTAKRRHRAVWRALRAIDGFTRGTSTGTPNRMWRAMSHWRGVSFVRVNVAPMGGFRVVGEIAQDGPGRMTVRRGR